MSTEGDNPTDKVVRIGPIVQGEIALQLREMYEGFVREELPENLAALLKKLDQAAKKKPKPNS